MRLSTRQEKSTQEMRKEGNIKKKISEGAGGNVVEMIQVLYSTPLSAHCLFRQLVFQGMNQSSLILVRYMLKESIRMSENQHLICQSTFRCSVNTKPTRLPFFSLLSVRMRKSTETPRRLIQSERVLRDQLPLPTASQQQITAI